MHSDEPSADEQVAGESRSMPSAEAGRLSAWRARIPYAEALADMEKRRAELLEGGDPSLVLCEHGRVITCGKSSKASNVLLSREELERREIELVEIQRGGDVTYHGPGQLMIYPVVHVGIRVSRFLETMASVLAELAASYGVQGARWRRDEAGVWLGERKLAACGLHLHRGVCIHGFALNVATPAQDWHCIVPCGLSGPGPISLAEAMGGAEVPSVEEVAQRCEAFMRRALRGYGL